MPATPASEYGGVNGPIPKLSDTPTLRRINAMLEDITSLVLTYCFPLLALYIGLCLWGFSRREPLAE